MPSAPCQAPMRLVALLVFLALAVDEGLCQDTCRPLLSPPSSSSSNGGHSIIASAECSSPYPDAVCEMRCPVDTRQVSGTNWFVCQEDGTWFPSADVDALQCSSVCRSSALLPVSGDEAVISSSSCVDGVAGGRGQACHIGCAPGFIMRNRNGLTEPERELELECSHGGRWRFAATAASTSSSSRGAHIPKQVRPGAVSSSVDVCTKSICRTPFGFDLWGFECTFDDGQAVYENTVSYARGRVVTVAYRNGTSVERVVKVGENLIALHEDVKKGVAYRFSVNMHAPSREAYLSDLVTYNMTLPRSFSRDAAASRHYAAHAPPSASIVSFELRLARHATVEVAVDPPHITMSHSSRLSHGYDAGGLYTLRLDPPMANTNTGNNISMTIHVASQSGEQHETYTLSLERRPVRTCAEQRICERATGDRPQTQSSQGGGGGCGHLCSRSPRQSERGRCGLVEPQVRLLTVDFVADMTDVVGASWRWSIVCGALSLLVLCAMTAVMASTFIGVAVFNWPLFLFASAIFEGTNHVLFIVFLALAGEAGYASIASTLVFATTALTLWLLFKVCLDEKDVSDEFAAYLKTHRVTLFVVVVVTLANCEAIKVLNFGNEKIVRQKKRTTKKGGVDYEGEGVSVTNILGRGGAMTRAAPRPSATAKRFSLPMTTELQQSLYLFSWCSLVLQNCLFGLGQIALFYTSSEETPGRINYAVFFVINVVAVLYRTMACWRCYLTLTGNMHNAGIADNTVVNYQDAEPSRSPSHSIQMTSLDSAAAPMMARTMDVRIKGSGGGSRPPTPSRDQMSKGGGGKGSKGGGGKGSKGGGSPVSYDGRGSKGGGGVGRSPQSRSQRALSSSDDSQDESSDTSVRSVDAMLVMPSGTLMAKMKDVRIVQQDSIALGINKVVVANDRSSTPKIAEEEEAATPAVASPSAAVEKKKRTSASEKNARQPAVDAEKKKRTPAVKAQAAAAPEKKKRVTVNARQPAAAAAAVEKKKPTPAAKAKVSAVAPDKKKRAAASSAQKPAAAAAEKKKQPPANKSRQPAAAVAAAVAAGKKKLAAVSDARQPAVAAEKKKQSSGNKLQQPDGRRLYRQDSAVNRDAQMAADQLKRQRSLGKIKLGAAGDDAARPGRRNGGIMNGSGGKARRAKSPPATGEAARKSSNGNPPGKMSSAPGVNQQRRRMAARGSASPTPASPKSMQRAHKAARDLPRQQSHGALLNRSSNPSRSSKQRVSYVSRPAPSDVAENKLRSRSLATRGTRSSADAESDDEFDTPTWDFMNQRVRKVTSPLIAPQEELSPLVIPQEELSPVAIPQKGHSPKSSSPSPSQGRSSPLSVEEAAAGAITIISPRASVASEAAASTPAAATSAAAAAAAVSVAPIQVVTSNGRGSASAASSPGSASPRPAPSEASASSPSASPRRRASRSPGLASISPPMFPAPIAAEMLPISEIDIADDDDFPEVSYGGGDDTGSDEDEDGGEGDEDEDVDNFVGSEKTYISPLYSGASPRYATGDF